MTGAATPVNDAAVPVNDAAGGRRSAAEWSLIIGGGVVGVLGGVATAIIEAFWVPLRWGPVRVPVSPVVAIVLNVALVWFTWTVTRRRGVAALPGIAWFVIMIVCTTGTTEGDIVFASGNWMVLVLILLGSVAWAVALARLIMPTRFPGLAEPTRAPGLAEPTRRSGPGEPTRRSGPGEPTRRSGPGDAR